MKFNKIFGTAILAGALTTVGFAAPQADQQQTEKRQGHHGKGKRGQHMFGRGMAALNLTDAQKQYARQLMESTRAEAKPIAEQLRQTRQDLAEAVKSNNTGAINQLTERQGQLQGQLSAIRGRAMAQFYAQLTPEQRTKAEEMRQNWQSKRGEGKGFRNQGARNL
jgi:periplasmic protein CpxP/Spy